MASGSTLPGSLIQFDRRRRRDDGEALRQPSAWNREEGGKQGQQDDRDGHAHARSTALREDGTDERSDIDEIGGEHQTAAETTDDPPT